MCPSLKQFSLMRFQIKQFFTTLKMQYLQEFFVKVGCVWYFKKYFDPIMRGILYMTSWQWQYSLLYLLRLFTRPFSEEKKTFKDSCSTQQCHSVQFIHTEKCCHVKMSFWCMFKKIIKIKQPFNLNHNHRIKNSKYDSSIKTKRENIFKDLFNHYFLSFCCLKAWCI